MMLFNDRHPWLRKSGNKESDVSGGCFDGALLFTWCLYILYLLRTVVRKENVGLYHYDGLGILQNSSGLEIEQKRKQTIWITKCWGLNITIKTNLGTADFLDVPFDLINNK